jgi:hypothetical protein
LNGANSFSSVFLRTIAMQPPEWLKPSLYDAVAALSLSPSLGSRGVTGGTARTMAADQSKTDIVALSLICVDQSKRDPQLTERVAALKAAASWERSGIVSKNGWATMPGTTEANSQVATDCVEKVST